MSRDTEVAPGVTTVATPGHTPGHLCVEVDLRERRCLLLGDAGGAARRLASRAT